jgi:hypothetical protein
MKYPFRAALMRSIRRYHIHQRTCRIDASARKSHDIGAASSAIPYLKSIVLTSEVLPLLTFDDEQLLTRGLAYAIKKRAL